jgi:chromosome partitioning protein
MSILLFVNLKGGVAKTTNAVAVAECLADQGYNTLLIDADHQCMAGELLLGESRMLHFERRKFTLHDLLTDMLDDEFDAQQMAHYVVPDGSNIGGGLSNLSVLPCSIRVDDFQTNVAKAKRGYRTNDEFHAVFRRRRDAIRKWLRGNFDHTIIDCPPSVALQVKVFMTTADSFIVPSLPDRLSVRGSLALLDRIRRMNYRIKGLGTLWSLYRKQNALHRKVIQATKDGKEPYTRLPRPFDAIIPNAAAIAESTEPDLTPTSFSAKYTPPFAKIFRSFCAEVLERSEQLEKAEKELIEKRKAAAADRH